MIYRTGFFAAFLGACLMATAQPRTDSLLANLLSGSSQTVLRQVLGAPQQYRCQVIYTRIDRDARNRPSFTNYYFNYDPDLYFNPASMVKMPLAFLSLEKFNDLQRKDISWETTIQYDSSQPWQRPLFTDSTAINGKPSIGHFIKKAFLISDNDAYNRMYQWLGQGPINRRLHELGYPSAVISRQFLGLTLDQNRHTNPIRFLDRKGKLRYAQPPLYNTDSFNFSRKILVGKAYMNRNDSLVNEPFDFSWHNNISLEDMQQMLQAVMFPNSVLPSRRFNLTHKDYQFLRYWMSAFPSETDEPKYDTAKFYDSYVKFFFLDSTHHLPEGVRVFNKVGWAYGFLTDVSYVADFEHQVEFMLAATVYVNKDEILNDDKYEFEETGHPFLYQLGQAIYQYELKRQRNHLPDLKEFQFKYGKRDPSDTRPVVKEADN